MRAKRYSVIRMWGTRHIFRIMRFWGNQGSSPANYSCSFARCTCTVDQNALLLKLRRNGSGSITQEEGHCSLSPHWLRPRAYSVFVCSPCRVLIRERYSTICGPIYGRWWRPYLPLLLMQMCHGPFQRHLSKSNESGRNQRLILRGRSFPWRNAKFLPRGGSTSKTPSRGLKCLNRSTPLKMQ